MQTVQDLVGRTVTLNSVVYAPILVAHRFCWNGFQLDLWERRGLDLGFLLLGQRFQLGLEVGRLECHDGREVLERAGGGSSRGGD